MSTNNPTCLEKVTDFGLWQEYLDPDGHTTKAEFDAMTIEEKLKFVHDTWPKECECE
jgi:hypothetical protein